jgi:FkbM family methyltransferase
MFGGRRISRVAAAMFGPQHYIALANMARTYPEFVENLARYLTGNGEYPYSPAVNTPLGVVQPNLYSHHDLLTLNEIFCRRDYPADGNESVVIDIGSNIGLSALFFLTRNPEVKCFLYEPDKRNTEKLRRTLAAYEGRFELFENAVSDTRGVLSFGIEPTGRYGGLGRETGETIEVECLDINDVLDGVLKKERFVDVLKIDTEGVEVQTVRSIRSEYLERIRQIFFEGHADRPLHADLFSEKRYGGVTHMTSRVLAGRRSI